MVQTKFPQLEIINKKQHLTQFSMQEPPADNILLKFSNVFSELITANSTMDLRESSSAKMIGQTAFINGAQYNH